MTARRWAPGLVLGALLLACAPTAPAAADPTEDNEALKLAKDAYVYGYPLVTMEMTRRVMTNTATPKGSSAPMGQFAHLRAYPTPANKQVTAPNADTLYSLAWLDLSRGPYVFGIPDAKDRYFLMPMLDGWTEVFQAPGKRTTGTKAQKYLISGPGWQGEVPEGLKQYKSPTSLVWVLGRTYCTGTPEDYKATHAFQDGLSLVPLSSYGKPYTPPEHLIDKTVDMKTPVREQVNNLDATAYFKLLAKLLKANPPATADAPMVAKLAKVGIVPGEDFDESKVDPDVAKVLKGAPKQAQREIMDHFEKAGTEVNGWQFTLKTGTYGTDYLQRALITAIGLGANQPQDAVYPTSHVDGAGKEYTGANKYVLRFAKGQTPPVNAFWSVTMYDADYFFVKNPLNKYTVSPRNDLKYNADGSLELYVQHESPGKDKEANWLPAPKDKFVLMMRMYWPKEAVVDGTWKPPAVEKVEKVAVPRGTNGGTGAVAPGQPLQPGVMYIRDAAGNLVIYNPGPQSVILGPCPQPVTTWRRPILPWRRR